MPSFGATLTIKNNKYSKQKKTLTYLEIQTKLNKERRENIKH